MVPDTMNEIECALEAVLFASGDSVHRSKLCASLGISEEELENAAENLADYYDFNRRGIKLLKLDDKYQLCSRGEYAREIRNALEARRTPSLSASALEVLAIIAYKQPITKAKIEEIRGVDSAYTVTSLAEKELIKDCGRLDVPGRPILYKTTEKFLRTFNISSLSELPDIDFNIEDNDQLTFDSMSIKQETDGENE